MFEDVRAFFDKLVATYASEDFKQQVITAKEKYFAMVGTLMEDDDDYESRMNAFLAWYLFQYIPESENQTFLDSFIAKGDFDEELGQAFKNIRYSIFEFQDRNFRGQLVLKDLVSREKYVLGKDQPMLALLKQDIFLGRLVTYKDNFYLIPGICTLPKEASSNINKQAKKVSKYHDVQKEYLFLVHLENLKTRWRRYGHIDADKIFSFN